MLRTSDIKHSEYLGNSIKQNVISFIPEHIDFSNNSIQFISFINKLTENIHLEQATAVVASSASALVALLVALGYTPKEIKFKLKDVCFKRLFNDTNNRQLTLHVISNYKSVLCKQFKLLEIDNFIGWLEDQINNKLENHMATFADLNIQSKKQLGFKNIHLIVLNIGTGKLEVFNYRNTPDLPLAIAVRICMSFSTAFSIVEIKNLMNGESKSYMDGGIVLRQLGFRRKLQ